MWHRCRDDVHFSIWSNLSAPFRSVFCQFSSSFAQQTVRDVYSYITTSFLKSFRDVVFWVCELFNKFASQIGFLKFAMLIMHFATSRLQNKENNSPLWFVFRFVLILVAIPFSQLQPTHKILQQRKIATTRTRRRLTFGETFHFVGASIPWATIWRRKSKRSSTKRRRERRVASRALTCFLANISTRCFGVKWQTKR